MNVSTPQELTSMFNALGNGDRTARTQLLRVVYDELHVMAAALMRGERVDHTLQATALVNEAYIRLLGGAPQEWDSRAHFFGAAAEVMRRILVDHAREKAALKRGGGRERVVLTEEPAAESCTPDEVISVDDVLTELEAVDERKAALVKLRFYAGLTLAEIAAILEVSEITVKRDWRFARAWLEARLTESRDGSRE
jgi:RNA polymerase sigma factor (TIGR02999 family)